MKTFICSLMLIFFATVSYAQIPGTDMIKNKVKDKAKEKVQEKKNEVISDAKNSASGNSGNSGTSKDTTSAKPASSSTGQPTSSSSSATSSSPSSGGAVIHPAETSARAPFRMNFEDMPMTDFHKQHVGQIVFYSPDSSDKEENYPITRNAYRPTTEQTTFNFRDALCCCFYLEHCLGNIPLYKEGDTLKERSVNSWETYALVVFIDGKQQEQQLNVNIDFDRNLHPNVFVTPLTRMYGNAEPGLEQMTYPVDSWHEILNNLSEGSHKIRLELWGAAAYGAQTVKPVCAGEFTLVKNAGDKFLTETQEEHNFVLRRSIKRFNDDKVKDNGMTSETHRANVGKIVFSKSPVNEGSENPSAFTNSFSGNDLVYARFYLPESFWNIPLYQSVTEYMHDTVNVTRTPVRNTKNSFYVEVLIDGKAPRDIPELAAFPLREDELWTSTITTPEDDKDAEKKITTFPLYFHTTQAERDKDIGEDQWAVLVNTLTPGEHTIQLKVWAGEHSDLNSNDPVCTGEIKYTKVAGQFITNGVSYSVVAADNKPGMSNPALEGQMKSMIQKDENVKTIQRLYILDNQWDTQRNELTGIILSRTIHAFVVYKDVKGYTVWTYATFSQDYNGSGYQAMQGGLDNYSNGYINPATLK